MIEGVQQIKFGGDWMSRFRFVEALRDCRRYQALCDLAKIGLSGSAGRSAGFSAQGMATELAAARRN